MATCSCFGTQRKTKKIQGRKARKMEGRKINTVAKMKESLQIARFESLNVKNIHFLREDINYQFSV